jgi:hypothetical protein
MTPAHTNISGVERKVKQREVVVKFAWREGSNRSPVFPLATAPDARAGQSEVYSPALNVRI